jgi:hypothetical protein
MIIGFQTTYPIYKTMLKTKNRQKQNKNNNNNKNKHKNKNKQTNKHKNIRPVPISNRKIVDADSKPFCAHILYIKFKIMTRLSLKKTLLTQ